MILIRKKFKKFSWRIFLRTVTTGIFYRFLIKAIFIKFINWFFVSIIFRVNGRSWFDCITNLYSLLGLHFLDFSSKAVWWTRRWFFIVKKSHMILIGFQLFNLLSLRIVHCAFTTYEIANIFNRFLINRIISTWIRIINRKFFSLRNILIHNWFSWIMNRYFFNYYFRVYPSSTFYYLGFLLLRDKGVKGL